MINERLGDPPSLKQLADLLNMSVSSLTHRFKDETGMTVNERTRQLRIYAARESLAQPGASVKAVARDLGFSSPAYFSRVFKEQTGLTPQEFIRGTDREEANP